MSNQNKKIAWGFTAGAASLIILVLVLAWFLLDSSVPPFHGEPAAFHHFTLKNLPRPLNYRSLPIPESSRRNSQPLGLSDLGKLESWMTFDYLNQAFHLPPDYLKTALAIKDSKYPFITINRYAKAQKISDSAALSAIRQAVASHLQP